MHNLPSIDPTSKWMSRGETGEEGHAFRRFFQQRAEQINIFLFPKLLYHFERESERIDSWWKKKKRKKETILEEGKNEISFNIIY